MKTEHTPGPWKLETVKTQIGICHKIGPFPPLRPGDGPSHACIYVDGRYRPEDDPESTANARLIAAAPDLLEACKLVVKFYSTFRREQICGDEDNLLLAAESAIAKATTPRPPDPSPL